MNAWSYSFTPHIHMVLRHKGRVGTRTLAVPNLVSERDRPIDRFSQCASSPSARNPMSRSWNWKRLNRLAQVVTLVTCIREVSGSNLGQHTDCPGRVFVVFLSPPRKVPGNYLKLGHYLVLPRCFQFIIRCLHSFDAV
jgi:hypothetical protein